MSAPYFSATDCRLAFFPFIPFTFAYIICISFFLFLIFCLFFPWAFFLSFCLFSIMRAVTVSLIRTLFFCFGFMWLGSGSVVIGWLVGFFGGVRLLSPLLSVGPVVWWCPSVCWRWRWCPWPKWRWCSSLRGWCSSVWWWCSSVSVLGGWLLVPVCYCVSYLAIRRVSV